MLEWNRKKTKKKILFQIICILGLFGGTRCDELVKLAPRNIQEKDDILLISIPSDNKTKIDRYFTVSPPYVDIIKQYMRMRPPNHEDRFFLQYLNGKVTNQPIGIHKFQEYGKVVARLLNLKDPDKYTGQ